MRFKTCAKMEGSPAFRLATRMGPLPFSASLSGGGTVAVREVSLAVGRIPFYVQVPFCARPRLAGAIGGLEIRLRPFSVDLNLSRLQIDGILGEAEGMSCELKGTVDCRGQAELTGERRLLGGLCWTRPDCGEWDKGPHRPRGGDDDTHGD